MDLPPAYSQVDIAPRNEKFAEPDGAGIIRVTTLKVNGKLRISYELNTRPAVITPMDYFTAQGIESILENPVAGILLLESNPSGTNPE